ncbi:MAG: 2-hydroxychromene-2-carboxylate isomerase [Myxococcota bacterium]|jgi:2-hydroxychromene-2-carboxylate isomerase|nr:2-hydroxychromene-2-carboxylate isomerase [Myxococcota bacterium]
MTRSTGEQQPVQPIHFWFEFASTYSYPAAVRITKVASVAGIEVVWEPFLLGPIFREQGWNDSPFNLYPRKGAYMWRDMERLCEAQGLPFSRPEKFPMNGLLAARVAVLGKDEAWLPDFVRAVYQANFAEGRDIGDPECIADILAALALAADELLERAGQDENKKRLREHNERANALGIFGAPTFSVGSELFWGGDRIGDAVAFARLGPSPEAD